MIPRTILLLLLFFPVQYVVAQKELEAYANKLSPLLKQTLSAILPADSVGVIIAAKDLPVLESFFNHKGRIIAAYTPAGTVAAQSTKAAVLELLAHPAIVFVDAIKSPKEEVTTGYLDLAVNKINYAQVRFPEVSGAGILVSVKEQRLDTADIDYINRYVNSGLGALSVTTHASIMATTIAGAGNSSPFARGAAPAARLTSSSFANVLPDADAVFQQYLISIQNHSYGTLLESYYGAEAAAYDQSSINNPSVVHVFSAGNAGLSASPTGTYAGMQGFANLTGNFKQAKNVLVVGAIDSFYNIAAASSKGPAFDGRIKPELVAFGEDGSSGAAALVSGTAALVQQAYKNRHQVLPSAALVKAVLLNSADDVGVPHPDYASGYGSLNGYEAVKTVVENRVLQGAVVASTVQSFTFEVPPHAVGLKVTLAWADTPAVVNTLKALVNDIDLMVTNSSTGERWLPWVLHHQPGANNLLQPATRQKDTLNNVEQVTIENPAAGTYEIRVQGSHISSASQSFALAYQVDTANYFEWTFPTTNEILIGGQRNVLRWQSNRSGTAALAYATQQDNWITIADAVDVSRPYFIWQVPDTLTTARMRMQFSNGQTTTDTLVISPTTNLQVGFHCADSFLLFWNHLPATQYQVYQLNEKYLEPAALANDTTAILHKDQHPSFYYSVAPLINGRTGLKSYTINYTGQGAECYFRSFYAQQQTADRVIFSAAIGSLYQVASLALQKQQQSSYTTLQTVNQPATTSFSFTDSALTQGLNLYRVELTLSSGAVLYSNEVRVYHFPQSPVIIYPNPARQQEPVQIITSGAGRYRIDVWNATGALVHQMQLTELVNQVPPLRLSKGVYFIGITGEDGQRSRQKLVVY